MRLSGLSRRSNPSVRAMGDVVSVNSEVPATSRISRSEMNTACRNPSAVTRMIHQENSTRSPCVKNRLMRNMNAMSQRMGRRLESA